MEDETIEDVKAAYGLLFRDMAALRVKADALCKALSDLLPLASEATTQPGLCIEILDAHSAIANYTGA